MVEVGFVLGKPPRRSPVLGAVVTHLRADGDRVRVHIDDGSVPGWLADVDVVALRGVSTATLELLAAVEPGIRWCDPPSRVLLARDRWQAAAQLRSAGIPVPRGTSAPTWEGARAVASSRAGRGVAVKARDGSVGRGARVLLAADGRLPDLAPFPGPYQVEDLVTDGASEVKLYRIGGHVAAFHRMAGSTTWVQEPAGTLRGITLRASDVLGLTVAGIDVLVGRDGPVVVDVNAFPSGRRLPDAVARLADHLRSVALQAPPAAEPPSLVGGRRR